MSETKVRTEIDILDKIEDYTRATMRNTERSAKNVAAIFWILMISIILSVIGTIATFGFVL